MKKHNKMEKKLPRIKIIRKIIVPHEKREIAFDVLSQQGSNDYPTIGKRFLDRNLKVPIGDYTAPLLHAAYCIPEVENKPEFKEIRDIMRGKHHLWVFNRNLWTSDGVYVVLDLNAIGTSYPLNQDELEKMLKGGKELNWGGVRFSEDGRVRFAPKGSYELGRHTSESLAKDGFVVASYNVIGAKNLGKVSTKFDYGSRVLGVDIQEGQNPEQRVSALCGFWNNLDVFGNYHNNTGDGYALGVFKDAEGVALDK
jgi:hypothetical protein